MLETAPFAVWDCSNIESNRNVSCECRSSKKHHVSCKNARNFNVSDLDCESLRAFIKQLMGSDTVKKFGLTSKNYFGTNEFIACIEQELKEAIKKAEELEKKRKFDLMMRLADELERGNLKLVRGDGKKRRLDGNLIQ